MSWPSYRGCFCGRDFSTSCAVETPGEAHEKIVAAEQELIAP
jgi:hypothetical protein